MQDRLDKLGLEFSFLDAVDGRKLYSHVPKRRLRAHFGCFDSHINALTELCNSEQEFGYILEDDALIDVDITRSELPCDGHLFYFGGHGERKKCQGTWDIAMGVLTTHAYAVRVSHIPGLLAFLKERRWKIDVRMAEYQSQNKCYISSTIDIKQADGYSDISSKVTKYAEEMAESNSRREEVNRTPS